MLRSSVSAAAGRCLRPTIATAILAVGLVLVGPSVVAVQAQSDTDPLRTVSVAAAGQSEVEPDQAVISLGVTTRGDSAQRATRKAAAAMDSVVASLRASGIEESDIKTTRLDLRELRQRDRDTGEVAVSWELRHRVKATVRDIESTGQVIDGAIAAGATNLDGVSFVATDPSDAFAEARAEAVANAAASATQLAAAAGVEVIGVLSIVEGGPSGASLAAESARFGADRVIPVASQVQPGTIDIEVRVYIEYEVA